MSIRGLFQRSRLALWQDGAAIFLRLSGWLVTTGLTTLGVFVLFFFILGSFTLGGAILQLDNLTSRFVDADGARQAQFQTILVAVMAAAFALIAFFRRRNLASCFRKVDLGNG